MKCLLASLLLLTSVANAKTETVQTLKPGAGQSEITPQLMYLMGNFKFAAPLSGESETNHLQAFMRYYYGVHENHAFGAEVSYQTGTSKSSGTFNGLPFSSSSKTEGLSGVILKYKGHIDLSGPTLYWGAGYAISPEPSKSETISGVESKSNASTGQNAYSVSGAVVMPVSGFKVGAAFEHFIRQEGKSESIASNGTSQTSISKGGNSTQTRIFAEADSLPFRPNIAIANLRSYSSETRSPSGATSSSRGSNLLGVELAARIDVATNFELIPMFHYYQLQDQAATGLSQGNFYFLGGMARFLF